jgi:hypothetical protein
MTSIAFGSPSRYIQGPGELHRLAEHAGKYGNAVFAVIDSYFYDALSASFAGSFAQEGKSLTAVMFEGEITADKIAAYTAQAEEAGAEVIAGIGGGKTLDTAKAVAAKRGCALIVAPTSASTAGVCQNQPPLLKCAPSVNRTLDTVTVWSKVSAYHSCAWELFPVNVSYWTSFPAPGEGTYPSVRIEISRLPPPAGLGTEQEAVALNPFCPRKPDRSTSLEICTVSLPAVALQVMV